MSRLTCVSSCTSKPSASCLISTGATQITVLVNEGGLKLLQIKDNGCGIHAEDFPILCHRHTTSKLEADEDLKRIQTLGFRGEALCSISFVSRLKIMSMRADAQMGHRAEFRDAEMTTTEPERCAAVQGTLITAEDMFYNVPNRLKAMSSATQEFHLIYDVVAKYAVFCTGAPCLCPLCLVLTHKSNLNSWVLR